MNLTCPCCHASASLEAFVQDDAARELLALRADAESCWPYLVTYLGFFRSKARALSWTRALRLAKEVLATVPDRRLLAMGLRETIEAMCAKRDAGDVRPLKNHNYLARVLESIVQTDRLEPGALAAVDQGEKQPAKLGKRAQGMAALEDWSRG